MRTNSVLKLLLWALYAVLAGGGFLLALTMIASRQGYGGRVVLASAGLFAILAGVIVFAVQKITYHRQPSSGRGKVFGIIAENMIFLLCLPGMVAVRVPILYRIGQNGLVSTAMVSAGQDIAFTGHGATDLFLWLLRGCFFVFGNKIRVAAVLLLVLQIVAAVFLYCAVRRLSGRATALIALGFFGFSPYLRGELMTLSPLSLFVALFSLTVWMISGVWSRKQRGPIAAVFLYLLIGILTGLCCWVDEAGAIVLVFLLWEILFYKNIRGENGSGGRGGLGNNRLFICVFCLAVAALSFLGIHFLIGAMAGHGWKRELLLSVRNFMPGAFLIPTEVYGKNAGADVFLMVCLLVVGIFSFFRGRMQTSCSIWIAAVAVLLAMQCFGIAGREPVNSFALLYLLCAAVAGNAVGVLFPRNTVLKVEVPEEVLPEEEKTEEIKPEEPKTEKAETEEPKPEELPPEESMQGDSKVEKVTPEASKTEEAEAAETEEPKTEELPPEEPKTEEVKAEEIMTEESNTEESKTEEINSEEEKPEIQYIENPLPLPKKSERNFMDFDYEVAEDDDFDIP